MYKDLARAAACSISLLAVAATITPQSASACGGFFCGFQPVDQSAERIIFKVNKNKTVTMAVQVQYQGAAEDFAWVLPLPEVPDASSLATFPLGAMIGLDARTGPQFMIPDECQSGLRFAEADAAGGPPQASPSGNDDGGVTVHIQQQVGNYEAAVVESDDPEALHKWLVGAGYRVGSSMKPLVKLYTDAGMKFLALKLVTGAGVEDIQPFMLTLPGETPSIPLRLTAVAAEPEMSLAIFIIGDMRYGGANWPDINIEGKEIAWEIDGDNFWGGSPKTNYTKLVADRIDKAGGQGWLTELYATGTEYTNYVDLLERQQENIKQNLDGGPGSPDDEEWREQQKSTLLNVESLLGLMKDGSGLTRLYARVSAEEMSSDPSFKRVGNEPKSNFIQLERIVDGKDMCPWADDETGDWPPDFEKETTPCDFATCGAGGVCRNVMTDDGMIAGCGCLPGASARTTVDADGNDSVVCQDQRMSFLNPGDRDDDGGNPLPDPCASFSCGAGGTCVAINMTPTCACDEGMVAIGSFAGDVRSTSCAAPIEPVPSSFYQGRLPEIEIQIGREVDVVRPDGPRPFISERGDCSAKRVGGGSAITAFGLLFGLLLRRRRN